MTASPVDPVPPALFDTPELRSALNQVAAMLIGVCDKMWQREQALDALRMEIDHAAKSDLPLSPLQLALLEPYRNGPDGLQPGLPADVTEALYLARCESEGPRRRRPPPDEHDLSDAWDQALRELKAQAEAPGSGRGGPR